MTTEQPKKPVGGAYGQFMAEKRPEYQKKCEGKPQSEVTKMAGENWKKLSDADKVPYQKKYEQVKAKFEVDMAGFLTAGGVKTKGAAALRNEKRKAKEGGGKKGKFAKVKDANHPKRPAGGAFGCFLAANRAAFQKECPGSITGVAKVASAKWKAASEADKAKFEKEYQAKKAAYEEAMKTYVPPAAPAAEEEDEEIEDASEDKAEKKKAAPVDKKAAKDAKKAEAVAAKDQKKADALAKKENAKSAKKVVAKAGKKGGAKKPVEPEVNIPLNVQTQAEKKSLLGALKKLMARPDVIEKDVTAKDALAALEANEGLLHPARRALLGA